MSSKHIAAIFLIDRKRAGELSECLAAENIESVLASTSDELYHLLNHQRIDVVVLDNDLKGFLTGLEIVERLFNDLLRPATVLLAQVSTDIERKAQAVGIDSVIAPDSNLKQIVDAMRGLLATKTQSQVVIPAAARKIVQATDNIRPMPQLLVKLCSYLNRDDDSVTDLAKDLSVDPKVTADLLKLTNSTALALRSKVSKVVDAVKFLGIRRTVSLVFSSNVISAQSKLMSVLPDSMRAWYHNRSVLIGSTASTFARRLEDVFPETAYILGLLQDIGILVLAQNYGDKYVQLLRRARDIGHIRLEFDEQQDYGTTHAEVSAALLQKWQLPQSLVSMVLAHHERDNLADKPHVEQRFLHVMQIGEAVANLSDSSSPQRFHALNQLLSQYGKAEAAACKACVAEGIAKTLESSELFSIPVPDDDVLNQLMERITEAAAAPPVVADVELPAPPGSQPSIAVSESPPVKALHSGSAVEPPAAPTAEEATGPCILVIEDELSIVRMIRTFLAPLAVEVRHCTGLQGARQLAPRALAIICDVHLGSENGVWIVCQLRAEGCTAPVIMISGDRSRSTVSECIEAGINDYLIKPFNKSLLLEKLRRHAALEPGRVLA